MIPQYITAKVAHMTRRTHYILGVVDEDYNFHYLDDTTDKAQARVLASNAATEYRVPIAKQAERLLNI